MKYIEGFRDPRAAASITKSIRALAKSKNIKDRTIHIMEVCGSHTMAIARFGIRTILPANIDLISGPGCPVCVTPSGYIDTAIELAKRGVIISTFGDMLNVPGSKTSLAKLRSEGIDVEVAYSPISALETAKKNKKKSVVFLAIGFETTIAPVISVMDIAIKEKIRNVSFLTAFKLVPPALSALLCDKKIKIDAFICPAHVSAIIGSNAYTPVAEAGKPCVVAGFEPLDILYGIQGILEQIRDGRSEVDNQYSRVVKPDGNLMAQKIMSKYLNPCDAEWRGVGTIPASGLAIKPQFSKYDALKAHSIKMLPSKEPKGCLCGSVIKGMSKPTSCALFERVCTPDSPIGPCMVSSEGTCSAYYKYLRAKETK